MGEVEEVLEKFCLRVTADRPFALLNSNWAAVAPTEAWTKALKSGQALERSDLGSSAVSDAALKEAS